MDVLRTIGLMVLAGFALAQEPNIPREMLENRRALQGDSIKFCVNPKTLGLEFDKAVANEIAKALLLKANFDEVTPIYNTQPWDYSFPLSNEELFGYLTDNCNAFMGFNIASNDYPEWLSLSRPYVETNFVLAVTNPEYQKLEDLPPDKVLGTRGMSAADLKLVNYLLALPKEKQWQRFPYYNNKILVEKLLAGEVAAALIWEPALNQGKKTFPKAASVRTISFEPFQPPTSRLAVAIKSQDTYLRDLLDKTIASLIKDGTIDRLLQQYAWAGSVPDLEARDTDRRSPNLLIVAAGALALIVIVLAAMRRRRPRRVA